jgi:hypothetical protein
MTLFYREAKQGGAIALAPARSQVWQNVTFRLCILLAAALRLATFRTVIRPPTPTRRTILPMA